MSQTPLDEGLGIWNVTQLPQAQGLEAKWLGDFKVPPSLKLNLGSRSSAFRGGRGRVAELAGEAGFGLGADLGILPLCSYVTSGKSHTQHSEPPWG